jgi:hypothetical protein
MDDIECFSDDDKTEKLNAYVEKLNELRKNEMLLFGSNLAEHCRTGNMDSFED